MWTPKIIPEAEKSFAKFDKSVKIQIVAGILKVSTNPLPQPNGYGKPLGNKGGDNLTGFFKIKYKGIGVRVKKRHQFQSSVYRTITGALSGVLKTYIRKAA